MTESVILTIDEQKSSRDTIRAILAPDGFELLEAADAGQGLQLLSNSGPDLVLLGLQIQAKNGLEFVSDIQEIQPYTPIIMITENRDNRVIEKAMQAGVSGHLSKPVNANDLRLAIGKALENRQLKVELQTLKGQLRERESLYRRMGSSDRVQSLVRLLEKISPTNFTVLIEGESGSGKELVAQAIHGMSTVSGGPFVPVDCGAIPDSLFESELFGYVKGAFTGAGANKIGLFEAADKGTLFLDEVCNLPFGSQQKLLRAIEGKSIQRVGSTSTTPVDVRIVAATNRSLEQYVEDRLFRVDLLYRLKEVSVRVPPLRQRGEDIFYLAQRFLDEFKSDIDLDCRGFSQQALSALLKYSWPGNVRELRNVVRQATLTTDSSRYIQPESLAFNTETPTVQVRRFDTSEEPKLGNLHAEDASFIVNDEITTQTVVSDGYTDFEIDRKSAANSAALKNSEEIKLIPGTNLTEMVRKYSQEFERKIIDQTLENTGGNKSQASKLLGVDYKTLYRKLKKYKIG